MHLANPAPISSCEILEESIYRILIDFITKGAVHNGRKILRLADHSSPKLNVSCLPSGQHELGGRGRGGLAGSRSISQPLADDAADRAFGALYVIHAQSDSIAIPKSEFSEVSVKMFFADVLIDAVDPTLQDREIAFCG